MDFLTTAFLKKYIIETLKEAENNYTDIIFNSIKVLSNEEIDAIIATVSSQE